MRRSLGGGEEGRARPNPIMEEFERAAQRVLSSNSRGPRPEETLSAASNRIVPSHLITPIIPKPHHPSCKVLEKLPMWSMITWLVARVRVCVRCGETLGFRAPDRNRSRTCIPESMFYELMCVCEVAMLRVRVQAAGEARGDIPSLAVRGIAAHVQVLAALNLEYCN